MTTKIKHNLFALKRRLEIANNRSYSWTEMAQAAGVNYNTLQNYAHNKRANLDFAVAASLLDFFEAEGLPLEPGDLLVREQSGS